MSAEPLPSSPAVVRSGSLANRSFLSDIVVDYGPADVLGRVFLKADTELRKAGVTMSFATLDELIAVNRRNSDSWRPILPLFDPDVGGITPETSLVMLGRNDEGEVVAANAARLYSLTRHSLKHEMEGLHFLYAEPDKERRPNERVVVTAPTAATMLGRVVFGGAVWFRPDMRGRHIVGPLSRLIKALTYTRWSSDAMFSIMAEEVVKSGVAQRAGFPHVEWAVDLVHTPVWRDGVIRSALIWTSAAEQLDYCRRYVDLPGDLPEVDRAVHDRAANQKFA